MKRVLKKVFALIDSCQKANIVLALRMIKNDAFLKREVENRYMPLIEFFKGKSLNSLASLEKKILEQAEKSGKPSASFFLHYTIPIGLLKNITELNWVRAEINAASLPAWLTKMPNLAYLNIAYNHFDNNLPPFLGEIKGLKSIGLNGNELTGLPSFLTKLKKLETLRIDDNPLGILPQEIFQYRKLDFLSARNCNLEEIPDEIIQLKKLKGLILTNNKIKVINPLITKLRKLERLYLDKNEICAIPPKLEQMKHLDTLNLENNAFEVPPYIELVKHKAYKEWLRGK